MLTIMCSRGCGVPISVSEEDVAEFAQSGRAINIAHERCPGETETEQSYRVQIVITRIARDGTETVLGRNGATIPAQSFGAAYEALSRKLSEQWATVGEWREVVELDEPSKTRGQAIETP